MHRFPVAPDQTGQAVMRADLRGLPPDPVVGAEPAVGE